MLCITSAVGRENDRLKLKKGIFFTEGNIIEQTKSKIK
jgi:hypothetical protein